MIQEHLADLDFRTKDERKKQAKEDFIKWYHELTSKKHTPEIQAQIAMLSAVLWYLLPNAEYKRLVTSKKPFYGY